MKKAFQIFGLALIASSLLFTACKKDEEDDTTNNEQQATVQNSLRVEFDGSTVSNFGYMNNLYQMVQDTAVFLNTAALAYSSTDGYTIPYFSGTFSKDVEKGNRVISVEYGNNVNEMKQCINNNPEYNPNKYMKGNWHCVALLNGNTLELVDPTNVIMNYHVGCVMVNGVEYWIEDKDASECTQKNLVAEGQGIKFDQVTK